MGGCIIVFAIKNIARWDTHVKVLSHADSYYKVPKKDIGDINELYENSKLLMWPDVYEDAEIWSTWAREQIKSQDNTCLKKVQPNNVKNAVKKILQNVEKNF